MRPFEYASPTMLGQAVSLLASPGSMPMAGGSDLLLHALKEVARREAERHRDRVPDRFRRRAAVADEREAGEEHGAAAQA